ncbi:DNA-binding transcriptional LysR family regulator [Paraburkholderia sp. BL27I4N3]|uniref:LysR family transcriptional regulator n=1 Tax=Paraburkholderia sp. BL27I4N3 TaxID=1938805 RepID=UPI000E26B682|nr:LysR family transcriptional regulator [Paraburkholderia sp. BL27I4N3]REE07395.1 DNA-binding transcriptional LysR family regulator [Paraburkholderia sp. BL27I4N3]
MELRQLQQFIVLAETLNFRATAERLFMTQPPLSVSIRKLEDEIGVKLFTRTTHDVQLTLAGEAILDEARQALFHATEVGRIARLTAQGLSGQLRIGFVGSAKYSLLPQLLPPFRKQYPEVALKFFEESNSWILEALESHRIDIGIVRVPLTTGRKIEYRVVEHDEFVIALPAAHPLAKKPRLALPDIAGEPFIQYTASDVPGLHALTMLLFQDAGFMPHVAQEAVQVSTVLFLVESGMGVALVPSAASRNASRKVAFRRLKKMPSHVSIGLAIAYNPKYETATARRFSEMAQVFDVPEAE